MLPAHVSRPGANLRGSVDDLASGALIRQGGVSNTIDYKAAAKLVICVNSQLSVHRSIDVKYGDYSFDPKTNRQILKNGSRVAEIPPPSVGRDATTPSFILL